MAKRAQAKSGTKSLRTSLGRRNKPAATMNKSDKTSAGARGGARSGNGAPPRAANQPDLKKRSPAPPPAPPRGKTVTPSSRPGASSGARRGARAGSSDAAPPERPQPQQPSAAFTSARPGEASAATVQHPAIPDAGRAAIMPPDQMLPASPDAMPTNASPPAPSPAAPSLLPSGLTTTRGGSGPAAEPSSLPRGSAADAIAELVAAAAAAAAPTSATKNIAAPTDMASSPTPDGLSPPTSPSPRPVIPPAARVEPPEPLPPLVGIPRVPQPPPEPIHSPHAPLLFECAWEVCWQLGGIYTVLRSKANAMLARWDDRYCLIGPYNPATAALEFEERPTEGYIRQVLDRLRAAGIPCHYGRWLIPGRPRVILLDYRARFGQLGDDKYLLWKDHGIGTNASDGEVNEVISFGFTVAEFFRHLTEIVTDRPILAHFHEWMGGVAIPRLAHMRLPVTTVFTTHATLLGRYLANDKPNFYEYLNHFDGDAEATRYQILPRHQIEKAAAHASVVFTTVSEVTAREAEQLLLRRPDVVVPNGLNIHRFAAPHEFQFLHQRFKERINEFVMGHFFPSYTFDLDRTLYFFTSGRYEYKNKGIDLYIEALWRLNERLKHERDRPTIVAFVITRAATRNINVGTLQSQAMFDELRNTCRDIERNMGRRLFIAATVGRIPNFNELLPDELQVRLKRAMHVWRSSRQPSIVTHDLADDAGDGVLNHLRHRRLFNGADDPVKVIFHPEFLSSTSPPMNLDYDNFVRGCHMGVFPSYYEPWGYTPMESVALGVPAVTTDLSGFGAYVQRHIPNSEEQGIYVSKRGSHGFDETADDLARHLFDFCRLSRRQRIELRNRVERLGEMFDWSNLVRHYHEAHDLALERTHGKRPGKLEVKMI